MTSDVFIDSANRVARRLDTDVQEIVIGLQRARDDGNEPLIDELMAGLASARAQRRALDQEVAAYQETLNPSRPQQTREQWKVKPAEQMTPQDALMLFENSKYMPKDPAADEDFARRYNEGVQEVARRRRYESGR